MIATLVFLVGLLFGITGLIAWLHVPQFVHPYMIPTILGGMLTGATLTEALSEIRSKFK